jgi:flagellar hook-basal body complex protein FliE
MEIKGTGLVDELRMLRGVEPIAPKMQPQNSSGMSFGDFLIQKITEANELGLEADRKIQDMIEGRSQNPHETHIALQKADVAFKLMLTVKDQLEQAYQTVMRASI